MNRKEMPINFFLMKDVRVRSLMSRDPEVAAAGLRFIELTLRYKYSLNFFWLGRPIVQLPQDIVAMPRNWSGALSLI